MTYVSALSYFLAYIFNDKPLRGLILRLFTVMNAYDL